MTDPAVRARAALALRRRRAERGETIAEFPLFGEWLRRYDKEFGWTYRHFTLMQSVLDDVTLGKERRALFNVAVRHGKTEHNTIRYAAYRLERDPSTRFIIGTYAQKQARKLSRQIRRWTKSRGVSISPDSNSVDEWETTAGGGVRAVGAGAGLASVNADVIIIDDPIGSRAEAESEAVREERWDWITSDVLARAEPHTAVLFSMPRWHQDDPAGRMRDRQAGRWRVVDLPGLAEEDDPLGREVNELLWPEHRGQQWMDEMKVDLGSYGFASLVQGRPRPREGGMFKWDWWQLMDTVPAVGPMVRYWDLAGTDVTGLNDPDYTAGVLECRMVDSRTAIVDVERFQKSVAARDARMLEVCKSDLAKYPGRIKWWIETEAGIAGKDRTAELMRRIQALGMPCYTEHATGKKEIRAEPLASAAEAKNVYLCPGEWRDPFRLEMADFPGGVHDDQADGASGAFTKLNVPIASISYRTARL